jgi:ribosomal protein S18 acetylase RimI-like enzyme
VEDDCVAKKGRVWVAAVDASAVGFVAVEVYDPERSMGEISMLAVDPDFPTRLLSGRESATCNPRTSDTTL